MLQVTDREIPLDECLRVTRCARDGNRGPETEPVTASKPNDVQSSSDSKLAKLKYWLHID
jgi:hypothetical protein